VLIIWLWLHPSICWLTHYSFFISVIGCHTILKWLIPVVLYSELILKKTPSYTTPVHVFHVTSFSSINKPTSDFFVCQELYFLYSILLSLFVRLFHWILYMCFIKLHDVYCKGMRSESHIQGLVSTGHLLMKKNFWWWLVSEAKTGNLQNCHMCFIRLC
jgi:hypothetical protein